MAQRNIYNTAKEKKWCSEANVFFRKFGRVLDRYRCANEERLRTFTVRVHQSHKSRISARISRQIDKKFSLYKGEVISRISWLNVFKSRRETGSRLIRSAITPNTGTGSHARGGGIRLWNNIKEFPDLFPLIPALRRRAMQRYITYSSLHVCKLFEMPRIFLLERESMYQPISYLFAYIQLGK